MIDPAADGEAIRAEVGDDERAAPPVVGQRLHPDLLPGPLLLAPETQRRGHGLVAVGEDVRLNHDPLADRSLGREASAVDLGTDPLDDDASSALSDLHET